MGLRSLFVTSLRPPWGLLWALLAASGAFLELFWRLLALKDSPEITPEKPRRPLGRPERGQAREAPRGQGKRRQEKAMYSTVLAEPTAPLDQAHLLDNTCRSKQLHEGKNSAVLI